MAEFPSLRVFTFQLGKTLSNFKLVLPPSRNLKWVALRCPAPSKLSRVTLKFCRVYLSMQDTNTTPTRSTELFSEAALFQSRTVDQNLHLSQSVLFQHLKINSSRVYSQRLKTPPTCHYLFKFFFLYVQHCLDPFHNLSEVFTLIITTRFLILKKLGKKNKCC